MRQLPDDDKLGELILYVAEKSKDDPNFSAVKLNRLLFYSDFRAYRDFGVSITGHEYVKLRLGPAPRRLLPVRDRLCRTSQARLVRRDYQGCAQERLVPLRRSDLRGFQREEIETVDAAIQQFWNTAAKEMIDASQTFGGWTLAADGEVIPYELALVEKRSLTPQEIDYGLTLQSAAEITEQRGSDIERLLGASAATAVEIAKQGHAQHA